MEDNGGIGSSLGGNGRRCYSSSSYILPTSGSSGGEGVQGIEYFNNILTQINNL